MRFVGVFLGAAIASLSFADAANAADRWSGFYTGLHIGHASGDFLTDDLGPTPPNWWGVSEYGSNTDEIFGGFQAGYNLTFSTFLIGVEGEFGTGLLEGRAADNAVAPGKDSAPVSEVEGDYYATIAGRAGLLLGPALVYGKAGWATVDAEFDWADAVYVRSASDNKSLDGAVYGGGLEFALAPGLSVKVEYLHFDIGDSTTLYTEFGGLQYQQVIKVDDVETVKIGVNVNLGD